MPFLLLIFQFHIWARSLKPYFAPGLPPLDFLHLCAPLESRGARLESRGAHFRFSHVLLRPWTFAPGLALLDFLIRAKLVLHYRNIADGKIGAALLQHKQSIELFEFE